MKPLTDCERALTAAHIESAELRRQLAEARQEVSIARSSVEFERQACDRLHSLIDINARLSEEMSEQLERLKGENAALRADAERLAKDWREVADTLTVEFSNQRDSLRQCARQLLHLFNAASRAAGGEHV